MVRTVTVAARSAPRESDRILRAAEGEAFEKLTR